jgi:hypothetical protein
MTALIEALKRSGWSIDETIIGRTTASKSYETAAGGRSAVVYFNGDQFHSAEYTSEGNNVLSTCSRFDLEQLGAEAFVNEMERKIDESYARRLHLQGAK